MVDFAVTVVGAPTVARAAELQRDVLTAAALWGAHLVGHASLEILVTVRPLEGAVIAQASSTQAFAEVPGVYQFGTVLELRSGEDPNGIGTDIWIDVDLAKLDRTDPIEVFTHELGHAFSFNGWGIGAQLQSSFDAEVRASASGPLFHGSAAMAIAGGPVPLAPESPLHYAQGGLMNPYNTPGRRHQIDALDIAFLSDSGVPVRERFGTLGNDSLALTPGDDVVYAGFGADVVFGN